MNDENGMSGDAPKIWVKIIYEFFNPLRCIKCTDEHDKKIKNMITRLYYTKKISRKNFEKLAAFFEKYKHQFDNENQIMGCEKIINEMNYIFSTFSQFGLKRLFLYFISSY